MAMGSPFLHLGRCSRPIPVVLAPDRPHSSPASYLVAIFVSSPGVKRPGSCLPCAATWCRTPRTSSSTTGRTWSSMHSLTCSWTARTEPDDAKAEEPPGCAGTPRTRPGSPAAASHCIPFGSSHCSWLPSAGREVRSGNRRETTFRGRGSSRCRTPVRGPAGSSSGLISKGGSASKQPGSSLAKSSRVTARGRTPSSSPIGRRTD